MMSDRLPWQRGDRPKHFIARMPEGTAEIWWKDLDSSPPTWMYRIEVGETKRQERVEDKQRAADRVTELWPDAVRAEQTRVAKLEAKRELEEQLTAANNSRRVDVLAFAINETSDYQRLVDILDFVRKQGWLNGPLKPLVEATSNELFRRRQRGR